MICTVYGCTMNKCLKKNEDLLLTDCRLRLPSIKWRDIGMINVIYLERTVSLHQIFKSDIGNNLHQLGYVGHSDVWFLYNENVVMDNKNMQLSGRWTKTTIHYTKSLSYEHDTACLWWDCKGIIHYEFVLENKTSTVSNETKWNQHW